MTAQEALNVLKNNLVIALHDFVYSAYIKGDDTGYEQEQVESLKTAIFALKKQIPQNPICKKYIDDTRCPTCNTITLIHTKYCVECGQALDWSGTDKYVKE